MLAFQLAAFLAAQPAPEAAPPPRRIILDVDPGIDDALAMFLAMQSEELRIEAVTVVSGNVIVDIGAENALKLVELAGRSDLIVARGAKYPLQKKLITAEAVHGEDGLGGKKLPSPTKKLDPRHAVDVIIDIVRRNPGQITLVPVGPLTNIALAFLKDPELRSLIPEIVLMGGSTVGGNASPAAEANIYNDPEAAKVVFESGIPIVMVDLGATSQARLTRKDLERLRAADSKMARYAAEIGDFYIGFAERLGFMEGADLHDPLAVGLAIDLSIATDLRPMHIQVETKGSLTYGETVANRHLLLEAVEDAGDHYRITSFPKVTPNARVPVVVDSERFLALFLEAIDAAPSIETMKKRKARIAVVGSANVDLTTFIDELPRPGETLFGKSFDLGFGGKGANQAVAASLVGAKVHMVARVGDDLFGPATLRNFKKLGVGTGHVEKVKGASSGVAPIFVDRAGQNRILVVKGANDSLTPKEVDRAASLLERADLIVMQLEIPLETVYHTIRFARKHDIRVLLNPAPAAPLSIDSMKGVTYLIPNEPEAEAIGGVACKTVSEAMACARDLVTRGFPKVILTLGERGAILADREGATHLEAYKVETVDSSGAGDAFIGSFAAFLGEGLEEKDAVARANLYAALSTTAVGTQKSFPTRKRFEREFAARSAS